MQTNRLASLALAVVCLMLISGGNCYGDNALLTLLGGMVKQPYDYPPDFGRIPFGGGMGTHRYGHANWPYIIENNILANMGEFDPSLMSALSLLGPRGNNFLNRLLGGS